MSQRRYTVRATLARGIANCTAITLASTLIWTKADLINTA